MTLTQILLKPSKINNFLHPQQIPAKKSTLPSPGKAANRATIHQYIIPYILKYTPIHTWIHADISIRTTKEIEWILVALFSRYTYA